MYKQCGKYEKALKMMETLFEFVSSPDATPELVSFLQQQKYEL